MHKLYLDFCSIVDFSNLVPFVMWHDPGQHRFNSWTTIFLSCAWSVILLFLLGWLGRAVFSFSVIGNPTADVLFPFSLPVIISSFLLSSFLSCTGPVIVHKAVHGSMDASQDLRLLLEGFCLFFNALLQAADSSTVPYYFFFQLFIPLLEVETQLLQTRGCFVGHLRWFIWWYRLRFCCKSAFLICQDLVQEIYSVFFMGGPSWRGRQI